MSQFSKNSVTAFIQSLKKKKKKKKECNCELSECVRGLANMAMYVHVLRRGWGKCQFYSFSWLEFYLCETFHFLNKFVVAIYLLLSLLTVEQLSMLIWTDWLTDQFTDLSVWADLSIWTRTAVTMVLVSGVQCQSPSVQCQSPSTVS